MRATKGILAITIALFLLPNQTYAIGNDLLNTTSLSAESEDPDLSDIFRASFELFQLLRNEKGIYRDAARFDGNHFHPASVAVIGMGLISLCIADEMEWIPNAEELAVITLRSITGNNPPFDPDRNQSGYFRHWI